MRSMAITRHVGYSVASIILLGCGSIGHAQSNQDNPYGGGSRLAPRRAQIVQSGPTAARLVLQNFGQCLYARGKGNAESFLSLPVDEPKYEKLQRALFDSVGNSCLEGDGTLRFSNDLLRGAIAEAAYRLKFGNKTSVLPIETATVDLKSSYKQPLSDVARRHLTLQEFGTCVAQSNASNVRAMLMSTPESGSEKAAFTSLSMNFSTCLSSGQNASFSKPSLRAILGEAMYRLSVIAASAQIEK
jgi:hypothetical protein